MHINVLSRFATNDKTGAMEQEKKCFLLTEVAILSCAKRYYEIFQNVNRKAFRYENKQIAKDKQLS